VAHIGRLIHGDEFRIHKFALTGWSSGILQEQFAWVHFEDFGQAYHRGPSREAARPLR
jgi:hypothetical protein